MPYAGSGDVDAYIVADLGYEHGIRIDRAAVDKTLVVEVHGLDGRRLGILGGVFVHAVDVECMADAAGIAVVCVCIGVHVGRGFAEVIGNFAGHGHFEAPVSVLGHSDTGIQLASMCVEGVRLARTAARRCRRIVCIVYSDKDAAVEVCQDVARCICDAPGKGGALHSGHDYLLGAVIVDIAGQGLAVYGLERTRLEGVTARMAGSPIRT